MVLCLNKFNLDTLKYFFLLHLDSRFSKTSSSCEIQQPELGTAAPNSCYQLIRGNMRHVQLLQLLHAA